MCKVLVMKGNEVGANKGEVITWKLCSGHCLDHGHMGDRWVWVSVSSHDLTPLLCFCNVHFTIEPGVKAWGAALFLFLLSCQLHVWESAIPFPASPEMNSRLYQDVPTLVPFSNWCWGRHLCNAYAWFSWKFFSVWVGPIRECPWLLKVAWKSIDYRVDEIRLGDPSCWKMIDFHM